MPPKQRPSKKRQRTGPTGNASGDSARQTIGASDEYTERIQEAFDTYADDDNGGGRISISRTKAALRDFLDIKVRTEEIRRICNDDETLNWNAFSKFTASKLRQRTKANDAFRLFDKDGKGLVCLEDVTRVAAELGESYSPDELEEMMHEADPSGEGLLDPEAFFRIVRKLNL